MKKLGKRLLLGSDEMIDRQAQRFAKIAMDDLDDMREAKIGFFKRPYVHVED